MGRVVEAVLPARFPTWVRSRPFSVLFLGDGVSFNKPVLVVRGFEADFPGETSVGWMSRDAVPRPSWWAQHFQTEMGPYNRGAMPPEGCYLFHLGWVVGHHPGTAVHGSQDDWFRVRAYLIDRIRLKRSHGADGTEWTSWGEGSARGSRSSGGSDTSSPRPRPRPRNEGPYEVLEIGADATDDEVRAAYRTALKLNHPDRCANLSTQIQEFAKERTQLIVASWSAIKSERGLR